MSVDGVVRCFDSLCYHFGGPLGREGRVNLVDLEDLGTHPVIRCPEHGHEVPHLYLPESFMVDWVVQISLSTGELLERDLEGRVQPRGRVQRIHKVQITDEGEVWVLLDTQGHMACK